MHKDLERVIFGTVRQFLALRDLYTFLNSFLGPHAGIYYARVYLLRLRIIITPADILLRMRFDVL